jgi:hypothetical protein
MNPRAVSVDHHSGAKDEFCAPHMFTHGHTLQLASVLRAHLVNLTPITGLLPGIEQRAVIDIETLLRPVFGHSKQGASFGHTKLAGKQVLRRGLSPLVTTMSTETGAPVIAGIRLRAGRANSGRGAASMIAEADPLPAPPVPRARSWNARRSAFAYATARLSPTPMNPAAMKISSSVITLAPPKTHTESGAPHGFAHRQKRPARCHGPDVTAVGQDGDLGRRGGSAG